MLGSIVSHLASPTAHWKKSTRDGMKYPEMQHKKVKVGKKFWRWKKLPFVGKGGPRMETQPDRRHRRGTWCSSKLRLKPQILRQESWGWWPASESSLTWGGWPVRAQWIAIYNSSPDKELFCQIKSEKKGRYPEGCYTFVNCLVHHTASSNRSSSRWLPRPRDNLTRDVIEPRD